MSKKERRKLWRATWVILMVPLVLTGCSSASVNVNLRRPEAAARISEFNRTYGVPTLTIKTVSNNYYSDDGTLENRVTYDILSLQGDGFKAAAQSISEWNEQYVGKLEMLRTKSGDYAGWTVSYIAGVTCTRMDDRVISFKQRWYEDDGEPWEKYFGASFDTISGKRLTLADIFTDEEGFRKKAVEVIGERLQESPHMGDFKPGYELIIENDLMADACDTWYLDACGITFCCRPYGHGAYAGYELVTVPYDEVSEYMKTKYCGMQGYGIAHIPGNETIRVNLAKEAAGGKSAKSFMKRLSNAKLSEWDNVMIACSESVYEEEYVIDVSIVVNDRQEELGVYYWLYDAYLLCQENDKAYLLLEVAFDYNYNEVYLYDITEGRIEMVEDRTAWIDGTYIGHKAVLLREPVDILGTYFVTAYYTMREESGRLVRAEERYTNENTDVRALHVIRELPVVIDGIETYLPPGSRILITMFEDEGIAHFKEINTKLVGEIHYTIGNEERDSGIYIDGVEEAFYFECLPYSG